jgi:hypothetical protein
MHTTKNTFGLWIVDEGEAEGVYTDRREDGVGLFLHASYFNHSCTYARAPHHPHLSIQD